MKEKLVIILLLELTVGCLVTGMRVCSEKVPDICMSNKNINITKARDHYKLQLCSSNGCTPTGEQEKWITCNKMCEAHELISDLTNCDDNQSCCEMQVMSFLRGYCLTNTQSTRITTLITSTRIISVIKTVKLSPSCTLSVSNQHTQKSTLSPAITELAPMIAEQASKLNESSLTILGVFLCLLVIALTAVSIGWMLTLWTMKKNRSNNTR